ncbi:MAG: AMMECR1 domain-containing protein [Pseudomonadota bacterium]
MIEAMGRRATFLPSVWSQRPEREDFLTHLKHKAGLPTRGWPGGMRSWRYGVAIG